MTTLTENELRAVAYYAIGVSTEGKDQAYALSFCGYQRAGGQLEPIGNSGYTIGEMQTDLGARPEVAKALVASYQTWARTQHPDQLLSAADEARFARDLGRDGRHIRNANFDVDNLAYRKTHGGREMPSSALQSKTGDDIDAAFKSRLNAYLDTDHGRSFVHKQDVEQVKTLMKRVAEPLAEAPLYKNASPEDQARMFATVAKVYNQNETWGQGLLVDIKRGHFTNQNDIDTRISGFVGRDPQHPGKPTYMESRRDEALKGAALFNTLRNADEKHPLHAPWQAVTGQGLRDPGALGNDARQPHLPEQYAVIKATFVQPEQGKAFADALDKGGSHHFGNPGKPGTRGFHAEGRDFVQWDRDGHGRSFIGGQWSEVQRSDLSLVRNKDRSEDLKVKRNGQAEPLLQATPRAARTHASANDVFEQLYQAALAGDDKAFSAAAQAYGRSPEGQAFLDTAHAARQQQDLQQAQQLAAVQPARGAVLVR